MSWKLLRGFLLQQNNCKKKQHTILRIKKSILKMTQDQSLMRCKSHFQTTIFEHDTAQVTQHSVKLSK